MTVIQASRSARTRAESRGSSSFGRPHQRSRNFRGWLFAAPSFAIIAVFILYPIVQSLWYSTHDWRLGATDQPFVGVDNYRRLIHDFRFWNALKITVIFTASSVLLQVVIGFAAAMALQGDSLLSRVVRSIYFFPTVVSLTTIGLVWRFLLDPNIGLVGGVTEKLGVEPVGWLQDPNLALPVVILVSVWKNLGFTMVILLAGLKGVPDHLYEAARVDGAGRVRTIWHITLPSIRPTLMFTTMILIINSLQMFDLIYVMTNSGPIFTTDTLVTMLYRVGFQQFDIGYASAIAWALFLLIAAASALQLKLFRYRDVD